MDGQTDRQTRGERREEGRQLDRNTPRWEKQIVVRGEGGGGGGGGGESQK